MRGFVVYIVVLIAVSGCAISLEEGAGIVQLIYTQPNKSVCQFLGQTSSQEGGMVSGDFMSDARIHEGVANQMKNKAYAMGGNLVYVKLQFDKNKHITRTKTNQTMIGFMYRCSGLKQALPPADFQ